MAAKKEKSVIPVQNELYIQSEFEQFIQLVNEWKKKVETLVVTDESQTDFMKMAKTGRLALRKVRTDADKKRKELKEEALQYGNAVQGVYKTIEDEIRPLEQHLLEQEKFVEYKEQARLEQVAEERWLIIENEELIDWLEASPQLDDDMFEVLFVKAKKKKEDHFKKIKEQEEAVERVKVLEAEAQERKAKIEAIEQENKKLTEANRKQERSTEPEATGFNIEKKDDEIETLFLVIRSYYDRGTKRKGIIKLLNKIVTWLKD